MENQDKLDKVSFSKKLLKFLKWFGIILLGLLVIGFIYEQIAEYIDTKTVKPPGQMIEVNGHKIHLYCTREKQDGKPTIVMIPGSGSQYFTFYKIQPVLSQQTQVCSYDPPGFGFSEGASDGRTAEEVSAELKELLVKANIEGPYLVVAYSLGGVYAQVFAKENIGQVTGMLLIDTTCEEQAYIKDPPAPWFVKAINSTLMSSFYVGLPRLAMTLAPEALGIHKDNLKIERALVAKPFKETNKISILDGALNSLEQEKLARNFGNLPIIIMTADQSKQQAMDMWGPEIANCHQNMTGFSANTKLVEVTNSSHFIQDDQPKAVIDEINKLLKH